MDTYEGSSDTAASVLEKKELLDRLGNLVKQVKNQRERSSFATNNLVIDAVKDVHADFDGRTQAEAAQKKSLMDKLGDNKQVADATDKAEGDKKKSKEDKKKAKEKSKSDDDDDDVDDDDEEETDFGTDVDNPMGATVEDGGTPTAAPDVWYQCAADPNDKDASPAAGPGCQDFYEEVNRAGKDYDALANICQEANDQQLTSRYGTRGKNSSKFGTAGTVAGSTHIDVRAHLHSQHKHALTTHAPHSTDTPIHGECQKLLVHPTVGMRALFGSRNDARNVVTDEGVPGKQ
jgi:hypothetical protein